MCTYTYTYIVYIYIYTCIYSARVDGLYKRELTATEMIEHFEDRADFLYLRHVTYLKPTGKEDKGGQREIVVSPIYLTHTLCTVRLHHC